MSDMCRAARRARYQAGLVLSTSRLKGPFHYCSKSAGGGFGSSHVGSQKSAAFGVANNTGPYRLIPVTQQNRNAHVTLVQSLSKVGGAGPGGDVAVAPCGEAGVLSFLSFSLARRFGHNLAEWGSPQVASSRESCHTVLRCICALPRARRLEWLAAVIFIPPLYPWMPILSLYLFNLHLPLLVQSTLQL